MPTRLISLGKAHGLQRCSTSQGTFTILAADHRDAFRVLINPAQPQDVPSNMLIDIKLDLVRHLAAAASAVLLDPVYGAPQAIAADLLPAQAGLLIALEEQGYVEDSYGRRTTLLGGWSAAKAKRLGATGVKLLLFYHPDSGLAAERQEQLVRSVVADCRRSELPLFLEPISYPLHPLLKKNSPEFASKRRQVVIESVRRLGALGPDVLKVEFPLDAAYESNSGLWAEACAELAAATSVPWVLLSAGEPFDVFCSQLEAACRAGAAGFAVGRSVWSEAVTLANAKRAQFLSTTARKRFNQLVEITQANPHSWRGNYITEPVDEHWFQTY
jgi:tagatose 1,6-diphosphate aldolase